LPAPAQARPKGVPLELALTAADGTLLDALPKMLWALWLGAHEHAAKLHFQFNILGSVPVEVALRIPAHPNSIRMIFWHPRERGNPTYA